ncbi:MAG: response regulator transcription factor [Planctomycetota bacterium]|jgi:two-component system OmpR family response regulator
MKPRILVVEDETHLAQGLKYNLEAEGYKVSLVDSGTTAVKLLESDSHAYDLLILDLMLPGMSGYSVCERLRELDDALPVLILSARSLAEDRTRGFDVGANQYLTKPFDLDELLARVRNLLRLHPRRDAVIKPKPLSTKVTEVSFGRAVVNFETYQVTVDGRDIKLTHKELSLLRYFVENQGRVISRQELLTEVWDVSGEMQTRSVDQFLLRLRKTFETDPANPKHFLTIRDVGYRFVSNPSDSTDADLSAEPDGKTG